MAASFEVDFSTLPLNLRYKLLAALVAPRPIALVTTVGKDGVVNAAPFSFFNVFSEDPALVVLGLQSRPDGTPKDTLKHIRETDVFVVNLGSVVHLHARAGIIDAERLRVNLDAYKPIARLFGNLYARLARNSCSSANPLPNGTPRMASTRRPIAPRRSLIDTLQRTPPQIRRARDEVKSNR